MFSRRRFVLGLASLPLCAAAVGPEDAAPPLRFMVLRHRTVLLELGGRRVLFDPCFARGLGLGALVDVPPMPVRPEDIGDVDLLCVGADEPGVFDGFSTRRLRHRSATCLVPTEHVARTLRGQGFSRVQVVAAGDTLESRGLKVTVSPAHGLFGGPGVGFLLAHDGRSFWHAGAPPPLDVDGGCAAFAARVRVEVLSLCAQGISLVGRQVSLDEADAEQLATLCAARLRLRLGFDTHPSGMGAWLAREAELPFAVAPTRTRAIVPLPSTWYRVRP